MMDNPPGERLLVSWGYVAAWALIIFASIPLARAVQQRVAETWGREAFTLVAFAALVIAIAAAAAALWKTRRRIPPANALWLLGIGSVFAYCVSELRESPEEALHFVQYGLLGVLVFRALSHSVRDVFIYPIAIGICTILGLADEVVQWVTPKRYFGFSDVWMNAQAATLSQLAIAFGLRPTFVQLRVSPGSVRIACRLAAVLAVSLGLCLSNTPARVEAYASRIAFLDFLRYNESTMNEFGYRHDDPRIGSFYSRLSLADLADEDRTRGPEVGAILDRYPTPDQYLEFLETYTPGLDPFVHEARVHLFSRTFHLYMAQSEEVAPQDKGVHWTAAYKENQILETYFGQSMAHSSHLLSRERRAELSDKASLDSPFVSRVSAELITDYTEAQLWFGIATVLAFLWFLQAGLLHALRSRSSHD